MKNGFLRWAGLFLVLASFPALACNLVARDEPTTPLAGDEVTVEDGSDRGEELGPTEPARDDAPTAGEGGRPFPEVGSLNSALEQFNSYRIQMTVRFEDASDATRSGTMTMNTSRIVNPPATAVEMQMSGSMAGGADSEGASLAFYQVGDTNYSLVPGLGCMSGLGGAEMFGDLSGEFDPDELSSDIESAEYVGEETVNGVATYHYRFDETDFEDQDEFSEMSGSIYISQEHQYVVRIVMEGAGEWDLDDFGEDDLDDLFEFDDANDDLDDDNDDDGRGTIHVEMNVIDVGQSFTIEAPAECTAAGGDLDLPVMEGGSELSSFAGLTTYSVNAPLQDVVAFYREEMTLRGYQEAEGSFIAEGTALMTFNAEGMPSVTVTLGADGGTTTVLITSE